MEHRTGNVLAEYFLPFWPRRYRALAEERRRLRGTTPARALHPAPEY